MIFFTLGGCRSYMGCLKKDLQELVLMEKNPLISLKAACVRVTSNATKEQLVNSVKNA